MKQVSLLTYEPTPQDIEDACLSYRHDFGLMYPIAQNQLRAEAREWLRAWGHTIPQVRVLKNRF